LVAAAVVAESADAPAPWPFAVDPLDQCETPLLAYEHLASLLTALARACAKPTAELRVYDPYYCAGGAAAHLRSCGFANVYHEREDFYQRIAARSTPDFDVLVTNPPWSGDHIERCLRFCRACGKPWACLLPSFAYLNEHRDHFSKIMRLSFVPGAPPAEPICVVPRQQYRYHERFLKSARDVRTRHFAFWCVDLGGHTPAVLTKHFWAAAQAAAQASAPGVEAGDEAMAEWRSGADTVRSVRHLPYHALDSRDPRKRKLAASRHKGKRARVEAEED
jgi:hypothetical protein